MHTHICLSSLAVELSSCHMQMHVLPLCACVCVCADVSRLMSCQCNKGLRRTKWRGGQPRDWQGRERLIQRWCHNDSLRFWAANGISAVLYILTLNFPKFDKAALFVSHVLRMHAPNLILDDVMCSCCRADRQFPHHNMGPYGPPVRLIDR